MQGKRGTMVEEGVEAIAGSQASFLVVDDSFGFQRTLKDYGFTENFTETSTGTRVGIATFYPPANNLAAAMNLLFMRRKLRRVVDEMLEGLRTLTEQRYRAAA